MGRRRTDSIDLACREWARERRRILGLDEFTTAREMIGALRSTLGQRRDLHAGATSSGRVEQHFPEVYQGIALEVHRAFRIARPEIKTILEVHYVIKLPPDQKAEALCISLSKYWGDLSIAKAFIEGRLTA